MTQLLSICIPTLNRCDYLCKALTSIFSANWNTYRVEVCVSDNASDHDYSKVHALLKTAPAGLTIRHAVQPQRMHVDEHMMAVKNIATAPYIYFLGDDDFFLDGQLPALLALIERETPDLAIFNGTIIDHQDRVISSHFRLPSRQYLRIEDAFEDLRDKGMFGSVLVKAVHLSDDHFRKLFGTAHGYGCYWFSLMIEHQQGRTPIILIPKFPLVALRMAAKSYNHVDVYYRDIPYEIAVYQRYLPPGLPQRLNDRFRARYLSKISSVRFLTQLRQVGSDIHSIRDLDPSFHRRHWFSIALGDFLARSGVYGFARGLYRLASPRRRDSA